jgi:transposase-like protein
MEDYPRTLIEFREKFANEDDCVKYLASFRWLDGFRCPRCGHAEAWATKRGLYKCQKCRYHTSITAGTIFHDSRKPLKLWFEAIWHITNQKYGANALGLQRVLNFGSYNTAWKWLHRLRRAMVRPEREKLYGTIEVDETFIGGERTGKRGRGAKNKTLVVIAVEDTGGQLGKGIGRIRLKRVIDASSESLVSFIDNHVTSGSHIRTDGWSGYASLKEKGYNHIVVGPKELNVAHLVASLLKRWLLGTYQGAVRPNQLDYYLDEYTFRFNRRKSAARGKLFYRLLQQAVITAPIPGCEIIGGDLPSDRRNHEIHDAPF